MMNNRQKMGLAIIVVAFIALVVIIYLTFLKKSPEEIIILDEPQATIGQLPVEPEITITPGDQPRNYQKYDISKEPEHKINENDLSKLAMSFSERLGSYSNQSNYDNFTDLRIFMTKNMREWAIGYVDELKKANENSDEYFGVSTKSLTSEVTKFDDKGGSAVIIVTTQRQESTAKINDSKTYLQRITITLAKVNGEWLVDRAYWEK